MSTTAIEKPSTTPVTGQLVQKAPPTTQLGRFKVTLENWMPQVKLALPKHIDPMRFFRVVLTAMQKPVAPGKPTLFDCTETSVFGCLMTCAQLGLEPEGPLGHAYLIPFKSKNSTKPICTLIVGYRGLVKLARNSDEIQDVVARIVHAKDRFQYQYGLHEDCVHVPTDDPEPGEVIAAYAVWRFKDGGAHFEVMTRRQLERIRARSKSANDGPWVTDTPEMQKKSVIRLSSKMVPASIDLVRALRLNDQADEGEGQIFNIESLEGVELSDDSAAPMPGVHQQGHRLSLGAKPDTLEAAATQERAEHARVAADGPTQQRQAEPVQPAASAQPATFVMSTPAARRALIDASTEARVALSDVCKRYGVDTIEGLDAQQVATATEELKALINAEPGSQG